MVGVPKRLDKFKFFAGACITEEEDSLLLAEYLSLILLEVDNFGKSGGERCVGFLKGVRRGDVFLLNEF